MELQEQALPELPALLVERIFREAAGGGRPFLSMAHAMATVACLSCRWRAWVEQLALSVDLTGLSTELLGRPEAKHPRVAGARAPGEPQSAVYQASPHTSVAC